MNLNVIVPLGLLIIGGFIFAYVELEGAPDIQKREHEIGTRLIGQSCTEDTDCSNRLTEPGSGGSLFGAVGCCRGSCQVKKEGAAGLYTCREAGDPIPEVEIEARRKLGLDVREYNTKELYSNCQQNNECSGSGKAGDPWNNDSVMCFRSKCFPKRRDWLGAYWVPEECYGSPTGRPGTCPKSQVEIDYEARQSEKARQKKVEEGAIKIPEKPTPPPESSTNTGGYTPSRSRKDLPPQTGRWRGETYV